MALQRTLAERFVDSCETYRDLHAVNFRPKFRANVWSYEDLLRHAYTFARVLSEYGVVEGDRVILIAPNSPYWVAAFWGIQLRGAIAVPLSPESLPDFVSKVSNQTEAAFMFKSTLLPALDAGVSTCAVEDIAMEDGVKYGEADPYRGRDPGDVAEIVYTSGTTGEPKGVMLSHENILSNADALQDVIRIDPTVRLASILPLFHMFEQTVGMIAPLMHGASISYTRSLNPTHLRWIFEDDSPNYMLTVPDFLRLMHDRIKKKAADEGRLATLEKLLSFASFFSMRVRRDILSSLHRSIGWKMETFGIGGAPLEPRVGAFWEQTGVYALQGYGLTETSPILTLNHYTNRDVASAGLPLSGVEIRIAEDGEVQAKGPNVFVGYWKDEERTRDAFTEDGWYKTGDIGFFENGHLYLKGRKKHMIVLSNGEKVHPEDIEREVLKDDRVSDAVVVGFPGSGGEKVHAVFLFESMVGAEEAARDIIDLVNARLAPHQQIQGYSFWPTATLPRTPTRKVKRHEVIERIRSDNVHTDPEGAQGGHDALREIVASVSEKEENTITEGSRVVSDLSLDSLKRIELVAHIERVFNVSLDENSIDATTTVADIRERIEHKDNKQEFYHFKAKNFGGMREFFRSLLHVLLLIPSVHMFSSLSVKGSENLKDVERPYLLFANHQSMVDTGFVYAALPAQHRKKIAVAAAADAMYESEERWIQRWYKFAEFLFAAFPFAREGQVRTSLEHMGRLLDRGYSVLFFPEGRISRDGTMQDLKEGAGLVAQDMNVPVVPVKIKGSYDVMPPDEDDAPLRFKMPRRASVEVVFGEPLYVSEDDKQEEVLKTLQQSLEEL